MRVEWVTGMVGHRAEGKRSLLLSSRVLFSDYCLAHFLLGTAYSFAAYPVRPPWLDRKLNTLLTLAIIA